MGIKRRWNGFGDWLMQLRNGDGAENGEVMVSPQLVDARGGVALVPSGERGKSQERQGPLLIGHTMPTPARKKKRGSAADSSFAGGYLRLLFCPFFVPRWCTDRTRGVGCAASRWCITPRWRGGGGAAAARKEGQKKLQGWCGYGLSAVSEPGNHQLAAEALSSAANCQPLSSAR